MSIAKRFLLVATCSALMGCIAPHAYVSNLTKEVPASEFKKPEAPRPVQLVCEFQTKGSPNARATEYVRGLVTPQLTSSGLFEKVTAEPAAGGALFSLKINNVPLTDNAAGKGFMTGLTFGLAGTSVTDGYEATATYVSADGAPALTATAKHAIHTTIGSAAAPPDATPAPSVNEAVKAMVQQLVSVLLNDLSHQPEFK